MTQPLGGRRQLDWTSARWRTLSWPFSVVALRGLSHETAKGGGEERNQPNLLLLAAA